MQVFQINRTAKLKHLAVVALLAATYGLGYLNGGEKAERKIAEVEQKFVQKEKSHEQDLCHWMLKASSFRFYDYDASGIKKTEIEKIRNIPLPDDFKDRFGKYRMREIAPAEIFRQDTLWHKQGKKYAERPRDPERFNELSERLKDTLGVYGDETYLQDANEYRQLWVNEVCHLTHGGRKQSLKTFKLNDDELREELRMWGYRQDARADLIQKILDMRMIVKMNNSIVDDMNVADSALFASSLEARIAKVKKTLPTKETAWNKLLKLSLSYQK